jgi:hypothetical protein
MYMSLSACESYLGVPVRSCKEAVRKTFDAYTTDKNKTLLIASAWNAAAAVFVSYSALKTENYNPREWWSDVAVHVLSAVTCAAEAITPSNAPQPIKSMLTTATSATIFANKARLAAIASSVAYNTQTIPAIAEVVDTGNHTLNIAILQKYGTK